MNSATTISVLDYRRHSMVLNWNPLGGTWTACDSPPSLIHGIALIRPTGPNLCVYGLGGQLRLQVGIHQYVLGENSPRVTCARGLASFGFRRRFTVKSSTGSMLFEYSYWTDQGRDFYRWLAEKAADPGWRIRTGREWSEGVASTAVRPY